MKLNVWSPVFSCSLVLWLLDLAAAQPLTCQLAKLHASDQATGNSFGTSVSIDNGIAVVGADHWANGDGIGSVYIFRYDGTGWLQEQELVAPDGDPFHDLFGGSVSISGNVILVGRRLDATVPGSGAAHVFRYDGNSWVHEQKLTAAPDLSPNFGWSVSIDNNVAVVGAIEDAQVAPYAGACFVFRFDGATWQREAKLVAPDGQEGDFFGASVSVSGSVIVAGAHHHDHSATTDAGAAYVFRHGVGGWMFEQELFAENPASGDRFGESLSLDGDAAIIGAYSDDDAAPSAGAAYVFRFSKPGWAIEQKLTASDASLGDLLGQAVAIDGDWALASSRPNDAGGSPGAGAGYLFHYDAGVWTETAILTAEDAQENDLLGYSVAINGSLVLLGATGDDDGGIGAGSAYLFGIDGDCNGNDLIDACEIQMASAIDTNDNLIPDECEVPYGDIFPSGGNFVLDVDDILATLGGFIDPMQFPEADIFPCNGNGVFDVDDITAVLNAFIGFPACVWSNGMWVPN